MSHPSEVPQNFLGLDPTLSARDTAKILIWPVPVEKTVSYGTGTADGPAAIVDASRYVELYDEELGGEVGALGVHTLPAFQPKGSIDEIVAAITAGATDLLGSGQFLCTLGGEHSITPPLVRAFAKNFDDLSVLQIDAHADLRDSYEGSPNSHACAMRRVVEICPAVQVGIRSLSSEEARAIPKLPTKMFYAKDILGRTDWIERAVESLSGNVYLTVDVDGLDPSIVPATGTPEPGGLLWNDVVALIRAVAAKRRIVGMDAVELCGSASNVSSFVVAKLLYKIFGYVFRSEIPPLA